MRAAPKAVPDSLFNQDSLSDETTGYSTMPPKNGGHAAGYSIGGSSGFTAAHRLLREDGFDRVVHAENIADKHLKIFFTRNSRANARLGIIVGKKNFPRAIDRNRIKRIIREAFRHHGIKAKKVDMVVMVKQTCAQEHGMRTDNLEILFSRVENRCAKL